MTARQAAPARPTDRLFFAIYPDAPALERLVATAQSLRMRHALRGRAFAPQRLHVTLAMAGDHIGLPPEVVERAMRAGEAAAAAGGAPFEVAVDRVSTFPRASNRPCVLLVGEGAQRLAALHEALEQALAPGASAAPARRPYRPHLTLQYDDRGLPDEGITPIRWTVRELVLVRSLLGRSQHIALARWPLHD